jgi:hypothetical protein
MFDDIIQIPQRPISSSGTFRVPVGRMRARNNVDYNIDTNNRLFTIIIITILKINVLNIALQ